MVDKIKLRLVSGDYILINTKVIHEVIPNKMGASGCKIKLLVGALLPVVETVEEVKKLISEVTKHEPI